MYYYVPGCFEGQLASYRVRVRITKSALCMFEGQPPKSYFRTARGRQSVTSRRTLFYLPRRDIDPPDSTNHRNLTTTHASLSHLPTEATSIHFLFYHIFVLYLPVLPSRQYLQPLRAGTGRNICLTPLDARRLLLSVRGQATAIDLAFFASANVHFRSVRSLHHMA